MQYKTGPFLFWRYLCLYYFLCVFFASEFAKNAKREIIFYKTVNKFEINRQKHQKKVVVLQPFSIFLFIFVA